MHTWTVDGVSIGIPQKTKGPRPWISQRTIRSAVYLGIFGDTLLYKWGSSCMTSLRKRSHQLTTVQLKFFSFSHHHPHPPPQFTPTKKQLRIHTTIQPFIYQNHFSKCIFSLSCRCLSSFLSRQRSIPVRVPRMLAVHQIRSVRTASSVCLSRASIQLLVKAARAAVSSFTSFLLVEKETTVYRMLTASSSTVEV